MDEISIVEQLGMVTSSTVFDLLDKNFSNVITVLRKLENFGVLTIEEFHHDCGIRKIYIENEIHKSIFTD